MKLMLAAVFLSATILCARAQLDTTTTTTTELLTSTTTTDTPTTTTTTSYIPTWFPDCGVATGIDFTYVTQLQKYYKASENQENLCTNEFGFLFNATSLLNYIDAALTLNCSEWLVNISKANFGYNGTAFQLQCATKAAVVYAQNAAGIMNETALQYLKNTMDNNKDTRTLCYGTATLSQYDDIFDNMSARVFDPQFLSLMQEIQTVLTYVKFGIGFVTPDNVSTNSNITEQVKKSFKQALNEFKQIDTNMESLSGMIGNEQLFKRYRQATKRVEDVQLAFETLIDSISIKDPLPFDKYARVCKIQNLHIVLKLINNTFNMPDGLSGTFPYMIVNLTQPDIQRFRLLRNNFRQDVCRIAYLLDLCDLAIGDSDRLLAADVRLANSTYRYIREKFNIAESLYLVPTTLDTTTTTTQLPP